MVVSEFLLAVLILELTPGPNMAYLASLAATRGRLAGLIAVLGVALGLATHAVVAGLGGGLLIERFPLLYEILRWLGVFYLMWLALEGWRGEKENSPGSAVLSGARTHLFWRGLLSNIFNPKSILFFVSVVPRFIAPEGLSVPLQLTVLGGIYVGVATAVHTVIVLLAASLQPWLMAGSRRTAARRVLSVALFAIALWLAWSTARA